MISRTVLLFFLVSVLSFVAADQCHPSCRWQCDDPSCPAVCHPVCSKPKCEMRCEETPCAKCVVHCERPVCSIRCPKDECELQSCPKCEVVCAPPQCHTTCTAPEPRCSPVCEELDCAHKCAKPTNCARPKCELQCEKVACAEKEQTSCCQCGRSNVVSAIELANKNTPISTSSEVPSFVETLDDMFHRLQKGETHCCPCA